jgi:hypothetical protein
MRREVVEIADAIKAEIEKLRQEQKERPSRGRLMLNLNISGKK